MQEALQRYTTIIRKSAQGYIRAPQDIAVAGNIHKIQVNLTKTCETLPHLDMDESCRRRKFHTLVNLLYSSSRCEKFLKSFFLFSRFCLG